MHSKHGLYVGWYLPDGHAWKIQGWIWGKPLNHTSKKGTIWLNVTEADKQYSRNDDLQVALGEFTAENYGKLWAVVAPKSFIEQEDEQEDASPLFADPAEENAAYLANGV